MNDTPTLDDSLPPPRPKGFVAEGETFAHYQVMRREDGALWELGRGAMGVTYKAFDTNLRCPVALKVISADHIHSETAGQRFIREARAAARLRHPNIASVYHLGTDPQGFFYSMEFIDGETLEDMVARVGPLPVESVLHVGLQVARALAAASRQGLIHRDIKPANVMVLHENEEGEDRLSVKVIDFGLARTYAAEDSSPALTATGFVGTPLFASPEQLEEEDLDVRSDIYSLGVTLWILLVGRPPFEGKMTQVITQHLHAPPPWWQLPPCPEPVRALLEKMLQKNRSQRHQSAGELRTAIESCLRAVGGRDVLLPATAEGSDPGEPARVGSVAPAGPPKNMAGPPKNMAAPASGTVAGHLGAAAQSFAQATSERKRAWPLVAMALIGLLIGAVVFWRVGGSHSSTSPRESTAATSPPPTAAPLPTPAAAPSLPAVALETPPPVVSPTPEPILLAPEPTPAATPPPLVAAASPDASGLEGLDGNPTAAPTVAVADSPTPSPAATDADADTDDASPAPSAKGSPAKTTRSRRSVRSTPTPAPNFFQKLFGIKPKPTPKKSR